MILLAMLACGEKDVDTAALRFDVAKEFSSQLSGEFDSSSQATQNPQYYDVSLSACPVEIPELGENVLYVEQALTTSQDSPYRQRVYVLELAQGVDTVQSHIFEINNPERLIGLCSSNEELQIRRDELVEKVGCTVTLNWNGIGFQGETDIGTCPSDMNGATFATSIVETTPDSITSWDRGYSADYSQVWGAVDGAYIFKRR